MRINLRSALLNGYQINKSISGSLYPSVDQSHFSSGYSHRFHAPFWGWEALGGGRGVTEYRVRSYVLFLLLHDTRRRFPFIQRNLAWLRRFCQKTGINLEVGVKEGAVVVVYNLQFREHASSIPASFALCGFQRQPEGGLVSQRFLLHRAVHTAGH